MNFYSFVFFFFTKEKYFKTRTEKKYISDHTHISVTLANAQYFCIWDKCSVDKPFFIKLRNYQRKKKTSNFYEEKYKRLTNLIRM